MLGSTVSRAHAPGAEGDSLRCVLHVVFPPGRIESISLAESELVLGRDPGVGGFIVDDPTVSRVHAALTWDAARGEHSVRDLGSRNGSSSDGVPLGAQPHPLLSGSVLRLGDVLLVYERDAGSDPSGEGAVSGTAIPGSATAMRRLRTQVARAARDPAPVLIIGETGTGKERIAAELHRLSGRGGRLVPLNCAALSAQLVESQLFGHVKGAFTGAAEAQPGLFRAAEGGSLFLDEIGELASELQPKLLRVLQEGEVLPVGGTRPVKVDVRVIAATHRELGKDTPQSQFRRDLYARISLWELRVPPLRERRVDLLGWIDRLHQAWARQRGVTPSALSFNADAACTLLRFSWPLNLRGLERLIHDLATAEPGRTIGPGQLPSWLTPSDAPASQAALPRPAPPAYQKVDVPDAQQFRAAFAELDGNVSALARRFARDRRQIYRWMDDHGLRPRAR